MAKAKKGRPSVYSKALVNKICTSIANGKSLREVCRSENMPSKQTVNTWLRDESKLDFLAQYIKAREEQADFYADEIIEIADTATDAGLARLQIDARKWKASKMHSLRYGDKVMNEHTGKDGGPILTKIQRDATIAAAKRADT